jgi:hypothetical protein
MTNESVARSLHVRCSCWLDKKAERKEITAGSGAIYHQRDDDDHGGTHSF